MGRRPGARNESPGVEDVRGSRFLSSLHVTRERRCHRLGLLLSSSSLVGCGSDDKSSGSEKPDLDFTAFDSAVTQFLAANNLEGASAVVVHKDWALALPLRWRKQEHRSLLVISTSGPVRRR